MTSSGQIKTLLIKQARNKAKRKPSLRALSLKHSSPVRTDVDRPSVSLTHLILFVAGTMSPLARRVTRLLTLLWAVGGSSASQLQPPSDVGVALDSKRDLGPFVQDVTSKMESLLSQLVSKIDGVDSRLASVDSRLTSVDNRLDGIETRLTALGVKQETLAAGLDDHSSRVESAEARLDLLVTQVSSQEARLGSEVGSLISRVESTEARLDSGLDSMIARVNFTEANFGSRVDRLADEMSRLAVGRNSRLDSISSQLDGMSSRFDGMYRRIDMLNPPIRDCSELPDGAPSGIYLLQLDLDPSQPPVSAYCDLETDGGGWTVIQRRQDIEPRQDFNLNWTDYRGGFGSLHGELWWGLQNLWKLTGAEERQYELRVDLEDFDGERRYAAYTRFSVGSDSEGYRLSISGYSGTAGDSLSNHNGTRFSTTDNDQDIGDDNCAQFFKGGWWFSDCYESFLNGRYLHGEHDDKGGSINWGAWRGFYYSLKKAEMKVRPASTD